MPKNDNAHSIRIVNSLRSNLSSTVSKEFENKFPLSKSADIHKKHEWAENICDYIEKNFDTEMIIKIRKECMCNDGKSNARKIMKYLNKADNIKMFVEAFNKKESFAQFEYISEHKIIFCYPECYCSCVKRIPKKYRLFGVSAH